MVSLEQVQHDAKLSSTKHTFDIRSSSSTMSFTFVEQTQSGIRRTSIIANKRDSGQVISQTKIHTTEFSTPTHETTISTVKAGTNR